MEGHRFDLNNVCGLFKRDARGNLIYERNSEGLLIDRRARRVNRKGYLVDDVGNVIDFRGTLVFERRHLTSEGEFPKIFPFSKFDYESIVGSLVRDMKGRVVPSRNPEGDFMDSEGRLVNERGYLVDERDNVIDFRGNFVFKAAALEISGEIPRVYRIGILRSASHMSMEKAASPGSINSPPDDEALIENELQLAEEEKHPLDGLLTRDGSSADKIAHFDEEEKPLDMLAPRHGAPAATSLRSSKSKLAGEGHEEEANSSVASLMEDTPSNYNIANQRFDTDPEKFKRKPTNEVEEEEEFLEEDELEGPQRTVPFEEEDEETLEDDEEEEDDLAFLGELEHPNPKQRRKRKKKKIIIKEGVTVRDKQMTEAYIGRKMRAN